MARRYTTQFKLEAVAMTRRPDTSVLSVARSLGIRSNTLQYWIDHPPQSKRNGQVQQPMSDDPAALKLQLQEAQKRIARLEQERDILKKATAYFASHST